ncbi:glutaredoxin domain-containing protein [Lacticaseibacillus paracasei]|uniref:glutaredoxin domain-containing protein n=2 Tax=Lacticaseibacillus paracasei TaxID=1597 RepID=UPI000515A59B
MTNTHAVMYTKPNCPACKMTTKRFDQLGYPYQNTYYGNANEANSIEISAADKQKREWSLHRAERLKTKYHIQHLPFVKIVDDGD